MIIEKVVFRDKIKELLIEEVFNNRLRSGEKLNLAKYARKLNTSVTPIREAFSQLEQSGLLEAVPNVGFCVRRLDYSRAKEIYTLIGLLESNSLPQDFPKKVLADLTKIHLQMTSARSYSERLILDNRFHLLLIDPALITTAEIIKTLKTRVFLYESEFMRNRDLNLEEDVDHPRIIELLQQKQMNEAKQTLRAHWMSSFEFITKNVSK